MTRNNMELENKSRTHRLVCLAMGIFLAALWAGPLLLLYFVILKDRYMTAFIAVAIWSVTVNGISFILNIADKILACCHCYEKRVPEAVLHFFTLIGGGPATVLAMFLICHKVSKSSYQVVFMVLSSLSITFIIGAFGLAYGLEWYYTNKQDIVQTVNTTTTVTDILTSSALPDFTTVPTSTTNSLERTTGSIAFIAPEGTQHQSTDQNSLSTILSDVITNSLANIDKSTSTPDINVTQSR